MTPQDIMDKTFEKAVFGGYDMTAVDDFLNQVRDEIAALQKENATLKTKLKVLATKIEEYRGSEDAMRLALVSAQKTGTQIEAAPADLVAVTRGITADITAEHP